MRPKARIKAVTFCGSASLVLRGEMRVTRHKAGCKQEESDLRDRRAPFKEAQNARAKGLSA
jgi:hypothetical protein